MKVSLHCNFVVCAFGTMRTHAVHRPRSHKRMNTWIATPLTRLAMAPKCRGYSVPNLVANSMPIFCSRGVGSRPPAQTITASFFSFCGMLS